ncbi:MAG TPA: VCBS repeat-containing protein [Pyrinomonadaceae bacterium]|nr:VCBS repeat-containing protein [Pyrinomonadaceae bacterium]
MRPARLRQPARTFIRFILASAASFLLASAASAQNASFAGRDYPIAGNNHAAADFNGDGKNDIAGAGGLGVRVMLNNGDGTFRAFTEYPSAKYTQDIAAGDLNGDGRIDLVATVLDGQTGLTVLLGNGDGTFAAPVTYANDTGADAPSIVLADFDHDARLDAVVAHQLNCFAGPCVVADTISLWRGMGDGTFQPPQQIKVGPGLYELAPADFNNDGHTDLAVAAMKGRVLMLLGNGDGTFRQLPDMTLVADTDNTDLDAADFNGDQIQDLVVAADADHRTIVMLGNGDGTFRVSASVPDAIQERPGQQAVGDFNGDTFQDVAIGMSNCCSVNGDGALGILFGNGNGTFRAVVRYLVPGAVMGYGGGVADASDFNGDGRKDILLQIRGNNPGTTVLLNTTGAAALTSSTIGGVQLLPSSVVGSTQTEVNVTLAPGAVAPSGSVPLSISSSNTSVATVPSGVRIIAGMTNVRFRVNTSRVTSVRTVTITVGTGRGSSRTATLTVTPPTEPLALGSVQLQPAGVFGGNSATGIVNLTTGNVAPAGGSIVSITNDNPSLVATPFNVTIPAGQSSATFLIQTQQTGLTTPVTITGTYGGVSRTATLTVEPPSNPASLISATLTPSTVVGGSAQGVRLQVNLSQGAPPEGATVTLSSDNPSVAKLPASLLIQSGGTLGFADFTTAAVSTPTQVTIRATYGGSTQSAVLSITPPAAPQGPTLSTLTLNPTAVTGGASAQGTVTLSGPAQAATVVNLSSGSTLASVPASVTVAAGSTSATFNITTRSVASATAVTVSATSGGLTRTAMLTINPAATNADTVAVQKAEYDSGKRTLKVEATSSNAGATLQVFVTSTGQLLGALLSNGGGKFSGQLSAATNPQNITVRSSLGGSATRAVAAK